VSAEWLGLHQCRAIAQRNQSLDHLLDVTGVADNQGSARNVENHETDRHVRQAQTDHLLF